MSQDSILELIYVTRNAVKALEKTKSSRSSNSGDGTHREDTEDSKKVDHRRSAEQSISDSGVGKTVSRSDQKTQQEENDSDDSTTASEVLIHSTVVEQEEKRTHPSSGIPPAGLDSYNLNTGEVKSLKNSKQNLREIFSPHDTVTMSNGTHRSYPVDVLARDKPSVTSLNANKNKALNLNNSKSIDRDCKHAALPGKTTSGYPRKIIPRIPDDDGKENKIPSVVSKDGILATEKSDIAKFPVYTIERHGKAEKSVATREFPAYFDVMNGTGRRSRSKLTSETGVSAADKHGEDMAPGEVRKNGMMISKEEESTGAEDDSSTESGQPDIITVPERLVNISSQAIFSDTEDSMSQGSSVDKGLHVKTQQQQTFPRAKPPSLGLKQGFLAQAKDNQGRVKEDDLHISKFSLTEKQRQLRDALAKRGNQSKAIKKIVHPKMVDSRSGMDGGGNTNNNMDMGSGGNANLHNMESVTAAVAASATAAVAQPLLKLQQDLEGKIKDLLSEVDRLHHARGSASGVVVSDANSQRLEQLEQQVKDLTERRLQHLEVLQQQQMQMQAHLLSISRQISQTSLPVYPLQQHQATSLAANVNNPPASRLPGHSTSVIESHLARGRMLGEHPQGFDPKARTEQHYKYDAGASLLDTPAPRDKPPRPVQYAEGKGGGILQQIMATEMSPQLNTTFSLPPTRSPAAKLPRARYQDDHSPVEKARKLVHDLSALEQQTGRALWQEAKTSQAKVIKEEPAPLEHYLNYKHGTNTSPYPKLHRSRRERSTSPSKLTSSCTSKSHTNSKAAAYVDRFSEARSVLQSVMTERQTLESNLELMLHSRQNVDVYAVLDAGPDSAEAHRIQKMVEKQISALQREVKREIEWDLQQKGGMATGPTVHNTRRKSTRPGRPGLGFGSSAPRMSRFDSGPARSQSAVVVSTAATAAEKKSSKARCAPQATQKSKIPYEDEEAMTKIYGKAQYQKGRTTVRDPYMHYQNQVKPRSARVPSPKRVENVLEVKSAKAQTEGDTVIAGSAAGVARRFYFTPSSGYVPLSSTSAPIQGQLIPTAVPLGEPRLDSGLAMAPPILSHPHTIATASTPIHPMVTAATNVALIGMTAETDGRQQRAPELGKQILPAVDIDSITPTSSPRGSNIDVQEPDISRNAVFQQTFHYQQDSDNDVSQETVTEDSEDQQGTGLRLPGHHHSLTPDAAVLGQTAKTVAATQWLQPPEHRERGRVPWEERCDELAEDLRHRDVLENKARQWLEQELMARLLMQMYPAMDSPGQTADSNEADDKSESIADDESLLVGDAIGRDGLQLFVDAGQPVSNALVTALMREVIEERVMRMLHEATGITDRQKVEDGGRHDEEPETGYLQPKEPSRIPTPQPTPRTSPIPGYVSKNLPTPVLTPAQSPEPVWNADKPLTDTSHAAEPDRMTGGLPNVQQPQASVLGQDSDTEVSSSPDISRELELLHVAGRTQQTVTAVAVGCEHDVATPTTTPPPTPPPKAEEQPAHSTPPPSPPARDLSETAEPPAEMENQGDTSEPEHKVIKRDDADHLDGTDQSQPLMVSVAAGPGPLAENMAAAASQQQPQPTTDYSEPDSASFSSSPSSPLETNSATISEGQWLLSRSEGQVAPLPINEDVHRMAVNAVRKLDASAASTLRDTDDLDLDETDVSRSEGEFHQKAVTDINPETDPVLALVLEMQSHPGAMQLPYLPANLQTTGHSTGEINAILGAQGHAVMGATSKSVGEITLGQVPASSHPVTMVAPSSADPLQQIGEGGEYQQQASVPETSGAGGRESHTLARGHFSVTAAAGARRQQQYQPISSGLPPSVVQGKKPLKSALVRSSEDSRLSRSSNFGSDSDRQADGMEFGAAPGSQQHNSNMLLQSATYASHSSGRRGSIKKSVEFDLSGTYQTSQAYSSPRNSEDDCMSAIESSDHFSDAGRSLGLSYSFEDSTSEKDFRSSGRSHLRMSVTIPTTGEGDSDISEIEISDSAAD